MSVTSRLLIILFMIVIGGILSWLFDQVLGAEKVLIKWTLFVVIVVGLGLVWRAAGKVQEKKKNF